MTGELGLLRVYEGNFYPIPFGISTGMRVPHHLHGEYQRVRDKRHKYLTKKLYRVIIWRLL